jgi:hypothetical protein
MKTISIPLSNGGFAIIDEQDAGFVLPHSWYSVKSRQTRYVKTGKNGRLHRMLLGVTDKSQIVDHINGNGLDNRRINLRVVDVAQNVANRQKSRCGNKCPGVYLRDGKWFARITVNYKQHRLGVFEQESDAISALNAFRVQIGRPVVAISE